MLVFVICCRRAIIGSRAVCFWTSRYETTRPVTDLVRRNFISQKAAFPKRLVRSDQIPSVILHGDCRPDYVVSGMTA